MSDKLDVFSMGVGTIVEEGLFEAAVLYGPPGSGKTHFALSASQMEKFSPMLVIDVESSTTGVIDNFRQRDPKNPEDISFDPERGGIIDVLKPFEQWGSKAYQNTLTLLKAVADGKTIYKSVSIDVANVFQKWGLDYHQSTNPRPNNSYYQWNMIDYDLTGSPLRDKDGNTIGGVFYALKMSGVLTFLVIHEREVKNEEGSVVGIVPQWGGQGKGSLGGIPDAMLYFQRRAKNGRGVTTMHTLGARNAQGKNRFYLQDKYEDPTFSQIYADAEKKVNK